MAIDIKVFLRKSVQSDRFRKKDLVKKFGQKEVKLPTIKLEAITTEVTGVHQDLQLRLNPCTDSQTDRQIVHHTLFQKPTNCHQYIPFLSAHRPHVFTNFVLQELKRYLLYCSTINDFNIISSQFAQRLTARGYPSYVFATALAKLPSRPYLLHSLKKSFQTQSKNNENPKLIVILNMPILRPQPNWASIFRPHPILTSIKKFNKIFKNTHITTSYKSPPNASKFLTHSKLPLVTHPQDPTADPLIPVH